MRPAAAVPIAGVLAAGLAGMSVAGPGGALVLGISVAGLGLVAARLTVLARRLQAWSPPPARYTSGVLAKYAKLVGSAATGAVCE
jgi:hypothetical protein